MLFLFFSDLRFRKSVQFSNTVIKPVAQKVKSQWDIYSVIVAKFLIDYFIGPTYRFVSTILLFLYVQVPKLFKAVFGFVQQYSTT